MLARLLTRGAVAVPASTAAVLVFAHALTTLAPAVAQDAPGADPLKRLQDEYVAAKAETSDRAFHFGSQGAGDVFSNHTSHTNRMVPVYTFGRKVDLAAITDL